MALHPQAADANDNEKELRNERPATIGNAPPRRTDYVPKPVPARQYTLALVPLGQQNVPALDPVRQSFAAPDPLGLHSGTEALFMPAGQSAAPLPTLQVSPKIGATRPMSMLTGFSYLRRGLSCMLKISIQLFSIYHDPSAMATRLFAMPQGISNFTPAEGFPPPSARKCPCRRRGRPARGSSIRPDGPPDPPAEAPNHPHPDW